MYSRNFRPSQKRTEGNVPVQYFGDSFSPDAFKYKNEDKRESGRGEDQSEKSIELNDEKTIAPTSTARKIDIEDLVLVGLLLLFLTDVKDKDDLVIPVILAAILLF